MEAQAGFVIVQQGVLIDPALGLRLGLGRWEPGYTGPVVATQELELHYDPEIGPDRLKRPIPEERLRRQALLGPIVDEYEPFQSDQSRRILSLLLEILREDDETKLLVSADPRDLAVKAVLLQEKVPPELAENPYEVIRHALASCLTMPAWDRREGVRGNRRVGLYLERPAAESLAAHTKFDFDRSAEGHVLVAARELQQ